MVARAPTNGASTELFARQRAVNAPEHGTHQVAGSRINGCTIQAYTKCPGAKLANAHLQGAFLGYATIDSADLSRAKFYLGTIAFANAAHTRFTPTQLGGTSAVNATLTGATFDKAELNLTNLVGANLAGASLTGIDGRLASFTNATLTGANLTETTLLGANLTGATFCTPSCPTAPSETPAKPAGNTPPKPAINHA